MVVRERSIIFDRPSFFLNMHPINAPEVTVNFADEKIDEDGRVTDGETREKIRQLLESLVAWTKRLRKK